MLSEKIHLGDKTLTNLIAFFEVFTNFIEVLEEVTKKINKVAVVDVDYNKGFDKVLQGRLVLKVR